MRLIFMGTPDFAVPSLERLISDGHDVTAVFTQPDKPAGRGKHVQQPPVKAVALPRGLAVHQPARIKTNEEVRAIFQTISPDACIVAAYGKILPEWMLAIPRLGCINVHASLLPKYRGAAPINWAIARGEIETGVTIMQMDAGMDTGPMLTRRTIPIGEEETAPELSARIARLGAELLSETLALVERSEVRPEPQRESEATYAPLLKREDGMIDWRMSAFEIANRVRAFQPWPGTYFNSRGGRLTIWRARAISEFESQAGELPGTILGFDETAMMIACSSGALRIEEVQIEGKRRTPGRDFANGARLKIGDRIT